MEPLPVEGGHHPRREIGTLGNEGRLESRLAADRRVVTIQQTGARIEGDPHRQVFPDLAVPARKIHLGQLTYKNGVGFRSRVRTVCYRDRRSTLEALQTRENSIEAE